MYLFPEKGLDTLLSSARVVSYGMLQVVVEYMAAYIKEEVIIISFKHEEALQYLFRVGDPGIYTQYATVLNSSVLISITSVTACTLSEEGSVKAPILVKGTVICRIMKVLITTKLVVQSFLQFLGGCDMVVSLHRNGEWKNMFSEHGIPIVSKKSRCLESAQVPSTSFGVPTSGSNGGIIDLSGLTIALRSSTDILINSNNDSTTCKHGLVFWIWNPCIRATNMSVSMLKIIVLQAQDAMTYHFTISDFSVASEPETHKEATIFSTMSIRLPKGPSPFMHHTVARFEEYLIECR